MKARTPAVEVEFTRSKVAGPAGWEVTRVELEESCGGPLVTLTRAADGIDVAFSRDSDGYVVPDWDWDGAEGAPDSVTQAEEEQLRVWAREVVLPQAEVVEFGAVVALSDWITEQTRVALGG